MKRILVLLSLTLCLAGTNAQAQEKETEDVTEYTFKDNLVEGELLAPDNTNILVRAVGRERSLIKIRAHFVPEMLKSVENI